MDQNSNSTETAVMGRVPPPPTGSPMDASSVMRTTLEIADALRGMSERARKVDVGAWKIIHELTRDPRQFPKATLLGSVETDIAEITIDGGSSKPIKIQTGADGDYAVYADNYQDGLPGRIIIEIAHPVKGEENTKLKHGETNQ